MLLALLSGKRCQTLYLLSVSCMVFKHDSCVFTIHKLLKTSQPGNHVSALTFTAYSPDSHLCPVVCLSEYVKRTSELRKGSEQLLLSFQKPYQPVSTDTISQWLKTVLAKSGIHTSVFKGHSTKVASATATIVCRVPLSPIMENAGWSNATTFGKFLSQQVKLMDSSCWKISTHRIVTVFSFVKQYLLSHAVVFVFCLPWADFLG